MKREQGGFAWGSKQGVKLTRSFLRVERHSLLPALRKIGEATYSEVFSCPLPSRDRRRTGTRELVVKILPFLGGPGLDIDEAGEKVLVNGCGMLEPLAVWTEIACCTRLSRVGSGLFGGFHRARVVKGSYPIELIREWNKWDSEKKRQGGEGSENWEPDYFPPHQHFVLIFLPFEGTDLELFPLPKWVHAESVFVQVTMALAAAERECGFEHRDLHAGNILLLDTASDDPIEWTDTSASVRYEFNRKGPKATVIDYTLSRFEDGGQLFYNPLEDEDIFNGEGDEQYEVYRRMRKATNGDWRGFWGVTNVIVGSWGPPLSGDFADLWLFTLISSGSGIYCTNCFARRISWRRDPRTRETGR